MVTIIVYYLVYGTYTWYSVPRYSRCPLLLDMDILTFHKQFLRLELPVAALGCLLLVPQSATRDRHKDSLLTADADIEILKSLREWSSTGFLLPGTQQVDPSKFVRFKDTCSDR